MTEMVECNVESCTYNRSRHCGASGIQIRGEAITNSSMDTCCSSYRLQGTPEATSWLAGSAEFKSGVTQLTDNEDMKPMVYCSVGNCRHYDHGCCSAPRLEIENRSDGSRFTTLCRTFQQG